MERRNSIIQFLRQPRRDRGRNCLVHLLGPGSVLAAAAAVRCRAQQEHHEPLCVTPVIHNEGLSDEALRETATTIGTIIAPLGWSPPLTLSKSDWARIRGNHFGRLSLGTTLRFRHALMVKGFDEIYYAHDCVGDFLRVAGQCYPTADLVTFGDAMGSVCDQVYLRKKLELLGAAEALGGTVLPRLHLARWIGPMSTPLYRKRRQPSVAILALPIDESGCALDQIPWMTVPKALVLDTLGKLVSALPDLDAYAERELAGSSGRRTIMVLENFTDGGRTDLKAEVQMYTDMIRANVPCGSTVYLKPHPLAVAPVAQGVVSMSQGEYDVRLITSQFARYPLELWQRLVHACRVIAMSYPNLSLPYLYGKEVVYPFSGDMARRYFRPCAQPYYIYFDKVIREKIRNLALWSGRGVIWRGHLGLA